MAETELEIKQTKDECEQIIKHIADNESFLLSGGAGSGKTHSLVKVTKKLIVDRPMSKIACITYTNAAVKEIEERVNHKNLNVSTIHDFLWDNIKHFQKELKLAIVNLINDENVTQIKMSDTDKVSDDFFDNRDETIKIQYKEYLNLKDGIISHDELIVIAEYMFKTHSKLCDITKDRYSFIFIDEYQDTHKAVIKIFLKHFNNISKKHCIIGFFGDSMQSIYDNGGDIKDYTGNEKGKVKEVTTSQNRRNPQSIINLANRLRTDNIRQVASADNSAPNMKNGIVKEGKINFIHSEKEDCLIEVRQFLSKGYGWDFSETRETKELNLTHNLIADKAGFKTLMDIYDKDHILRYRNRIKEYIKTNNINDDFSEITFGEVINRLTKDKDGKELKSINPTSTMNEFIKSNEFLYDTALNYNYTAFLKIHVDKNQLIDDKKQDEDYESKKGSQRDNLIRHLYKLQTNISLYTKAQYSEFIRITDYKQIRTIEDKITLKKNIESLIEVGNKTIEEVINNANEKRICLIDDKLKAFQKEKAYIYNRVKDVKYEEFQKLYDFLEGKTPFSTQHKTKGAEFNNVLVILDNGKWNNYNFEGLFSNNIKGSVLERTQKIFYVCCTRAKENLAVFYHNPTTEVLNKAKEWFGNDNITKI